MYIHVHELTYLYVHGTYTYTVVHELIYLYVRGTHTFMNVNIYMDIVQTRLYSFTTTLHFPSGLISLATPASLSYAQAQAPLMYVHCIYMYILCTCIYCVYTCTYTVHGTMYVCHCVLACTAFVIAMDYLSYSLRNRPLYTNRDIPPTYFLRMAVETTG